MLQTADGHGSRPTEDRTAPGHALEIRDRRGLDVVAARLHRPGLEPQPRDRGGVAIEAIIGVTDERIEGLGMRTLDAPQKILADTGGARHLLDGLERLREQRPGLGGGIGHYQDMAEGERAAFREALTRRHPGIKYRGQKIARHLRLRIIASATRRATAWIVEVGFTPAEVTITLPSTM